MHSSLLDMAGGVRQALRAEPVQASVRVGERPKLHPRGRHCSCGNPLNIYNGSPSCHACQYERDKTLFLENVSLRTLMEEES